MSRGNTTLATVSNVISASCSVRIYDLLLVFGNAVFLLVLFIHMVPTVRKLSRSLPLFKILYSLV